MAKNDEKLAATKTEIFAEEWWKKHGFDVELMERRLSRSVYRVSKDGLSDQYEIPFRAKSQKELMKQFMVYWDLLKKVKEGEVK